MVNQPPNPGFRNLLKKFWKLKLPGIPGKMNREFQGSSSLGIPRKSKALPKKGPKEPKVPGMNGEKGPTSWKPGNSQEFPGN